MEKFKDYLVGTKFIINPGAHLQSAKLGTMEQCWVTQLASFDFEVKYRAEESTNADALFRFPTADPPHMVSITNNDAKVTSAVLGQEDISIGSGKVYL